jgi:hypothetical protein
MFLSQTHFARKLESIKDIYSEAEQRVRVTQTEQSTTQRVTHKGVTTTVVVPGPGSTQAGASASPTKGKTGRGPAGECFCFFNAITTPTHVVAGDSTLGAMTSLFDSYCALFTITLQGSRRRQSRPPTRPSRRRAG